MDVLVRSPTKLEAVAALSSLRQHRTFVFTLRRDSPIEYPKAGRTLAGICKRAGIRRIGWHVLRHTFASWLCADGVPIVVVKALLGHASIEMTMRYAHLAPSSLRSAIDVFDRQTGLDDAPAAWAPGGQRAPEQACPSLQTAI